MMTQIKKSLEQATIDPQGLIFYDKGVCAQCNKHSSRNDLNDLVTKVFKRSEASKTAKTDPKGSKKKVFKRSEASTPERLTLTRVIKKGFLAQRSEQVFKVFERSEASRPQRGAVSEGGGDDPKGKCAALVDKLLIDALILKSICCLVFCHWYIVICFYNCIICVYNYLICVVMSI